jgi:ribosome biogenesis GTPase A
MVYCLPRYYRNVFRSASAQWFIMTVNWFPKHMRSSEAVLLKNLKSADVIFEVLDARIPRSSRDSRIDSVIHQKPRIVVLNKCDLSDPAGDAKWIDYFNKKG